MSNFEVNPRKPQAKDFANAFKRLHWTTEGRVQKVIGNVIEVKIPNCSLGTLVSIVSSEKDKPILAELVGFRDDLSLLIPFEDISGLRPGAKVCSLSSANRIAVGDYLLGQVTDPFLNPMFSNPDVNTAPTNISWVPIESPSLNPMRRARISKQLTMGVRAIDGLLSFGEGQRVGVMAGSGVGKSVLLGMIAKGSDADVNIIALVGERGREVREFIERDLGAEGLKKSVVIAATSDKSPLLRIRAAKVAVSLAEYFSAQGKKVMLMMDSLSRVAQAQREIGLSVGEPPTSRGYPPSVFSLLPRILERCGPREDYMGSISGLFTVLVDGDDFSDPIPDAARSILDGHINLSRNLANKGHFPAIDISTSVSRVMMDITSKEHHGLAQKIRALIATYQENIDFVHMGSYQQGLNPILDLAIQIMPRIDEFLKQDRDSFASIHETIGGMIRLLNTEVQSHE